MKDSNFFITKLLVGDITKADVDKKAAAAEYSLVSASVSSDRRDKMLVN